MIEGLIKLLAFQVAGEAIVFALAVPIPGPVVGMALLFLYLVARGREDENLDVFTAGFLRHLSLFFVPATVGIVAHLDRLAHEWFAIAVALIVSTLAAIMTTGLSLKVLKR